MRNGAEYIRRELMIRLVRAFDAGTLASELDRIPVRLRPRDTESSRCCIYRDRAVLRYRLKALLGAVYEDEDEEHEAQPVAALLDRPAPDGPPLTVCGAGCSGCEDGRYVVTDNCRGCFARPCVYNCPRNAVSVVNQRSQIDYAKCVKCGKCQSLCPFNAITRTTVPCEEACPVGAIRKNGRGVAEIDFDACIFCGKCFRACPFGAVMERSQMLEVLRELQNGRAVAMVAPSADAQFPGSIEQLFTAISQLGFADVVEVALGAEETTAHEAEEFVEKMAAGQKVMTTSCCPAYVELVRKHLPDFLDKVSSTPSPMVFTARMVRRQYPEAKTVFIGPCIAKRREAAGIPEVDYVLSFEEVGAMLAGRNIDVIVQEPWKLPRPAAAEARNFARSCGVTRAVLSELTRGDPAFELKSQFIDGIDRKALALLKACAAGKLDINFLEVMACPGGCVSGPGSLSQVR